MSTTQLQDAEYWKTRYEQERERLAKLWVAYKTLEAELSGIDGVSDEDMPPRDDQATPERL